MPTDNTGYTPRTAPKTPGKDELDIKKLNAEIEVDDLRVVLSTEEGMRFVQRLMQKTHVRESTFTGNSQGHFLEGMRAVGTWILDKVVDNMPELVAQVLQKPKQYK